MALFKSEPTLYRAAQYVKYIIASKKLYEHIALQGNTVTITDVEAAFIARLLKEA